MKIICFDGLCSVIDGGKAFVEEQGVCLIKRKGEAYIFPGGKGKVLENGKAHAMGGEVEVFENGCVFLYRKKKSTIILHKGANIVCVDTEKHTLNPDPYCGNSVIHVD